MTSTIVLGLGRDELNQHAKYLGQRSFRSKVIIWTDKQTDRQTDRADRLLKAVGNKANDDCAGVDGSQPESCAAGGRQTCNANAVCRDYATGFCCECTPPYIGNGYECVRQGTLIMSARAYRSGRTSSATSILGSRAHLLSMNWHLFCGLSICSNILYHQKRFIDRGGFFSSFELKKRVLVYSGCYFCS